MTICTCGQTIHNVGKDMWLHEDGAAYCKNTTATPAAPNEPTLTCSEVVERLAKECLANYLVGTFDRAQATAILHSWRERRVQELEEALRPFAKFAELIERDELDERDKWRAKGGGSHGE